MSDWKGESVRSACRIGKGVDGRSNISGPLRGDARHTIQLVQDVFVFMVEEKPAYSFNIDHFSVVGEASLKNREDRAEENASTSS